MKKLVYLLVVFTFATVIFSACKTTEENYHAAYQRAIAGRDSAASLENTIYGADRRPMDVQRMVSGTDTFDVRVIRVAPTEEGGIASYDAFKQFNVVVGQFKQKFNALSMRDRLVEAGHTGAFVVHTAEPYHYIVLSTHDTRDEAVAAIRAIGDDFPIAMRKGLPFILSKPLQ